MSVPKHLGVVIGLAMIPILLSLAMIAAGVFLYQTSQRMQVEPQSITCRQLIDNGPGDNAHLLLREFDVVTDGFVIQEDWEGSDPDLAWIPLKPVGSDVPESFRVILISEYATQPAEVAKLAGEAELQGTVENVVGFLTAGDEEMLRENFPGSTTDNCWLVRHHRRGYVPPPPIAGLICSLVGLVILVASLLGAGGIILVQRRSARPSEFHIRQSQPGQGDDAPVEAVIVGVESGAAASTKSIPPPPSEPAPSFVLFDVFNSRGLATLQRGIAVVRCDYVAFLPTEKAINMFVSMGQAVSGIQPVELTSARPIDELVLDLWQSDPDGFDQNLRSAAGQHGGVVWDRDETEVARSRARSGKELLAFWRGANYFGGTVTPGPVLEDLLADWQLRPAPVGPTVRTLSVVALLPTVIAIICLLVWSSHSSQSGRDLGPVSADVALDKEKVSAGDEVSVTFRADLESIWELEGDQSGSELFVVGSETPRLIVFCRQNHAFSRRYRRAQQDANAVSILEKPATFTGRIYNGDDVEGFGGDYLALRDFARRQLRLKSLGEARILAAGQPPLVDDPPLPLAAFYVWGGFALFIWLCIPLAVYMAKRRDKYSSAVFPRREKW